VQSPVQSSAGDTFGARAAELASRVGLVGLLGVAVVLYTQPQFIWPELAPLRVGVIVAAVMWLGLGLRFLLGGPIPTAGGRRVLALLVFVGIGVSSIAWSLDPLKTREDAFELLKMGVVYVAAVSLLDRPSRVRKLAWAMGLAGVVPAYYTVERMLQGKADIEGYRSAWIGNLGDPNRLAMSVVASALLLLALRSRVKKVWLQVPVLAAIGLELWAMVTTYSRGASVGLSVGVLSYLLLSRGSRARALVAIAAMAVGLLWLAPQRFWNRTETIATYEEDASAMGRIHAWQTAENILKRRPVQGVGLSAFMAAWPTYSPPDAGAHPLIAHNLILEIAAELGLFALIAFLILAGSAVWGAWRAAKSSLTVHEEARGALAALAGYLTCHMFAGHLMSFYTFLLLGLAAAAERIYRRETVRAEEAAIQLRTPLEVSPS
jgi:putative inorganic carbon (HCO3(-)) transporter